MLRKWIVSTAAARPNSSPTAALFWQYRPLPYLRI